MGHRVRQQASKIVRKLLGYDRRALARMTSVDRALVEQIKAKKLTYLSASRLESIIGAVRGITAKDISGIFVEAGCALGGSTILISKLKKDVRPLKVYDVFGMIPAPNLNDAADAHRRYEVIEQGKSKGIGGDKYYGYEKDLYERVKANLSMFDIDCGSQHVELIKGLLQTTMTIDEPVAFAHIDVDWYEPVRFCLMQIVPKLSVGGMVIIDDYGDWGGCKRATDEYFAGKIEQFSMHCNAGPMKITRLREGALSP